VVADSGDSVWAIAPAKESGEGHAIALLADATPPALVTPSSLAREIAALQEASTTNLKERRRALYGTEPPRRISRDLLTLSRDLRTRALAYRIQEKALGGLKPSTCRLLTKVAAESSARRPIQIAPEPALKPGTVLLREWHGTQHQVIVREDGDRERAITFACRLYQVRTLDALPGAIRAATLALLEGPIARCTA
jgi:hypothetical protein